MDAQPRLESAAAEGAARSLLVLRHALADPLSSASLKLDLIERKLTRESVDVAAVVERVRGVKDDLSAACRSLDLLLRLAEILAEVQQETLLHELCTQAGLSLPDGGTGTSKLRLRRQGTVHAIRSITAFLASIEPACEAPLARAGQKNQMVVLSLHASGTPEPRDAKHLPAQLMNLPPGVDGAEGLYMARAVLEADGGRLDIEVKDERLVAELSWPAQAKGAID